MEEQKGRKRNREEIGERKREKETQLEGEMKKNSI